MNNGNIECTQSYSEPKIIYLYILLVNDKYCIYSVVF